MDLTEILSQDKPEHLMDQHYEANNVPRKHLGLSQCGHECDRYLWYKYHGHIEHQPEGRILRLFELGNVIEDIVVADLRKTDCTVSNQQEEVVFDYGDLKLTGHTDGRIEGLKESGKTHLLEIKSANDKSFKLLLKNGYENWNCKYKFQIHAYMLGLNLDRCLTVVYNKNTSEVRSERINLKKQWIIGKLEHVFEVISEVTAPNRSCPKATWWKSKFCNYKEACFK